MKKLFIACIIVFVLISTCFGQSVNFQQVKQKYESFEFEKTIQLSNELLKDSILSAPVRMDIYLMRAISFFSIGDEINCRSSFFEILKLNRNYSPNPSAISPKIIELFNEVKTEFSKNETYQMKTDSVKTNIPIKVFDDDLMKNCAIRNLIVPGWGQIYSGNTIKGIILSTLSTATLASMIHYISDANKKEDDYLNESTEELMQGKYDSYNKSYKIRNALIISYAAVWLFSQLDLLFFSDEELFLKTGNTVETSFNQVGSSDFKLNFRISF
jgi:hypothetical protein